MSVLPVSSCQTPQRFDDIFLYMLTMVSFILASNNALTNGVYICVFYTMWVCFCVTTVLFLSINIYRQLYTFSLVHISSGFIALSLYFMQYLPSLEDSKQYFTDPDCPITV